MRREGRGPRDEEKGAGDPPWPPASVAQPATPTPGDASLELALRPRAGHREVIQLGSALAGLREVQKHALRKLAPF